MMLHNAEVLRMMIKGSVFVAYFLLAAEHGLTDAIRKDVRVFYLPGQGGRVGELCWCDSAERTSGPGKSLPVTQLERVLLGKGVAAFQSRAAAHADPRRCFTFMGRGVQINMETDAEITLSAWLWGLATILQGEGKRFLVEEEFPFLVKSRHQGFVLSAVVKPLVHFPMSRYGDIRENRGMDFRVTGHHGLGIESKRNYQGVRSKKVDKRWSHAGNSGWERGDMEHLTNSGWDPYRNTFRPKQTTLTKRSDYMEDNPFHRDGERSYRTGW